MEPAKETQTEEEDEVERARHGELIRFVDDFIQAEEFPRILRCCEGRCKDVEKKFVRKRTKIEPVIVERHLTATQEAKRLWRLQRRFQERLHLKTVREILEKQEQGIQIIKEKMAQAKAEYYCHKEERSLLLEVRRREALKRLEKLYQLNLLTLPPHSKPVQRVLAYEKVKHVQKVKMKERYIGIVEKILREYKRQREIDGLKHKSYDYKVRRKERIIKGMEVVGERMPVHQLMPPEEEHVEEEEAEKPQFVVQVLIKRNRQEVATDKMEDEKEDKDKKEDDKSKKDAKPEEEEPALILPYVPIVNQREKITLDLEEQDFEDVLKQIDKMESVQKEREMFEIRKEKLLGPVYETDPCFFSTPKTILFANFRQRVSYSKRLKVINGGTVEKKCRFLEIRYEDSESAIGILEVETPGAQSLIPGFGLNVAVKFNPDEFDQVAKGILVFLTHESKKNCYSQLSVPFCCIPLYAEVTMSPAVLAFPALPVWTARKLCYYKNFKILKFKNSGMKPCRVTVIKDQEQLDEDLGTAGSSLNLDSQTEVVEVFRRADVPSTSSLGDINEDARTVLQEYMEYVLGPFIFTDYCFDLPGMGQKDVRVYFRHVGHVGPYVEKYLVNFYEQHGALKCIGSQELIVKADVTGPFIRANPETLDFNACVFNSVYQLSFTLKNEARLPYRVAVRFPPSLRDFFCTPDANICMQAGALHEIFVKFTPRKPLKYNKKFYDHETKILEFPIDVTVTSKSAPDVPPTQVVVFAILTEPNGLALSPVQKQHAFSFNKECSMHTVGVCNCKSESEYFLDLGVCTTQETVFTQIKITNGSFVFHDFAFLSLPECIKVTPSYGFGKVCPEKSEVVTLCFSPEVQDIPTYSMQCKEDNKMLFGLSVDTLKNIGGVSTKKKFDYSSIRASSQLMEKELDKTIPRELAKDIQTCMDLLRDTTEDLSEKDDNVPNSEATPSEGAAEEGSEEDELALRSCTLWLQATIVDPLCELSHQYIQFPDTPCGSFTTMTVSLRALTRFGQDCACGYTKKYTGCKNVHYWAHFEIVGGSGEIGVEPTCGDVRDGQEIKLLLVAQPQMPHETIMNTAKELKRQELRELKQRQWELKQEQLRKAEEDKIMKSAGGSKGKVPLPPPTYVKPPMPQFTVEDNEIVISYLDMYPAEMVSWKTMEPWSIQTEFCCTVTYNSPDFQRRPEKLYFSAACPVVRPDFINNLKTQRIDFGCVAIGMAARRILTIENIQCDPIAPTITHLSPSGPFALPNIQVPELEPQDVLKLPVTFTPFREEEEIEYFEIKSNVTTCRLIVSGVGVLSNLVVAPEFVVCRLEAKVGGFADCSIDLNNPSKAPLLVRFERLCELVGEIKPLESQDSKAKTPPKPKKFSEDLTEEEAESLKRYFFSKAGQSYFELLGAVDDAVEVPAQTKKNVKIRFGVPLSPEERGAKGKKPEKSSGGKSKPDGLVYVAKFNITLGSTFLRDAIIIATFV